MAVNTLLLLFVSVACVVANRADDINEVMATFPDANKMELLNFAQQLETQPGAFGNYDACPNIKAAPDTDDINKLRPGNIRIVAAMGDSITCGSSAKDTSFLSLRQYRGIAYAIGQDTGVVSLVSLLKQFTPTGFPIGFSTGIGERTIATNGYNAGVSGAKHADMPAQATWLVDRIKANNTAANFNNYWKLVTIWIGSNNLCDFCNNQVTNGAAAFEASLDTALTYLKNNLPRTFVNLVANLEITQISNFKTGTCSTLHSIACSCGSSSSNATRTLVLQATRAYVQRLYNLQAKFGSSNNFAVVVQPFLENAVIPSRAWLSTADCFHPSALAHEAMGVGLWNNMISPQARKSHALSPTESPICPTDDTLFYTN